MITTTAGTFEADSPFMRRPWAWGMDNIGVTQSGDSRTIVVQPMPQAKSVVDPKFASQSAPVIPGNYIRLFVPALGPPANALISYVGPNPPP
jgi:hypothetical protein